MPELTQAIGFATRGILCGANAKACLENPKLTPILSKPLAALGHARYTVSPEAQLARPTLLAIEFFGRSGGHGS